GLAKAPPPPEFPLVLNRKSATEPHHDAPKSPQTLLCCVDRLRAPCPSNCLGLLKQYLAHKKKLDEYLNDPAQHDNKGLLGKGRDKEIKDGRVRSLQKQIDNFLRQLLECLKANG
ncbi:MAG: hypothetical protein ABL898_18395, partial [Hyphomicrobiaceae bacterium]